MPRTRPPLPPILASHNVATDWKTGDVVQDAVFQRGKWWDSYKWAHDSDGVSRERDKERLRRNRSVSRFLGSQTTDPGL